MSIITSSTSSIDPIDSHKEAAHVSPDQVRHEQEISYGKLLLRRRLRSGLSRRTRSMPASATFSVRI
ncbi:hypothetical protein [Pelagicoccus mobilis]|uniref:Uncharacterized protein n=1 Tax=Pelagicoccus mobilis TaxID=415221 RepID=A0A934RX43_9BACT|nr:hypothetical protein [Pelagicoccus mobilis]MBK1876824.1 hypothetical protein [Pelagicoccus mobilis]